MVNPYESPRQKPVPIAPRVGVRRYAIPALLSFLAAFTVSLPGLFLLNQQLQVIPVATQAGGFYINDQPVSTATMTTFFLGTATALLLFAGMLAAMAYSNHRKNLDGRRHNVKSG